MAAKTSPKTKPARKSTAKKPPAKKARVVEVDDATEDSATSSDDAGSAGYDDAGDGSDDEDDEAEVIEVDSDDLDGSDDEEVEKAPSKKRKAPAKSAAKPKGKKDAGGKNTREVEVGEKTPAPKEKATTSLILPSTMEFLQELHDNNDREWLAVNDAPFRHGLLNWNTFINALVPLASEADWTLPQLPSKDVVHRIYRDVRFSNDKTPYKTNFALSLSRTGRKSEKFCLYYLHIAPGGRSVLAAGKWQPGADVLRIIRTAILADPKPLRDALSEPAFVKLFGAPKPGSRTSVFGHDDELKNCPKIAGVTKEHPDIDLLKLRSIAVQTRFEDDEVLSENFLETVKSCIEVLAPPLTFKR
ncbi:hypothetical protein RQP46_003957 [Phenoliferia psychrophenolica]